MLKKNILSLLSFFKICFLNSYFLLASFVFLVFSYTNRLFTFSDWRMPLAYEGDNLPTHAFLKNYMDLEWIQPFSQKLIPRLGSPDIANWSAIPVTEELPQYFFGLLGNLVGLYPAMNLMYMTSFILAALSFYYVANFYKIKTPLALSGAIAFTFSHFILIRGLGHFFVGFCWYLPIMIMLVHWSYVPQNKFFTFKRKRLAYIFSIICGSLNFYFSAMIVSLFLISILTHIIRKNYSAIFFPVICSMLIVITFFIWHFDTFIYNLNQNNNILDNNLMRGRSIHGLQLYALQLPELFFDPRGESFLGQVGSYLFYGKSGWKGEFWSPYLGVIGALSFLFLILHGTYRLLQGKLKLISLHYFHAIWIVLFSIVGGINLLLGTVGFTWFRATNRYSIIILIISLLFTLKFISKHCSRKAIITLSLIIIGMTYFEFIRDIKSSKTQNYQRVISDISFVDSIENELPNAKIFQLPIVKFPESPSVHNMTDYEHLRPYLHSSTLSFSYGNVKGSGTDNWQEELTKLPIDRMIDKISLYGFDIILYNKNGYVDNGELLSSTLIKKGFYSIADSEDFRAFVINDDSIPDNKKVFYEFGRGWSSDEGSHRWSNAKNSEIIFNNFSNDKNIGIQVSFKISSLRESNITVFLNNKKLETFEDVTQGILNDSGKITLILTKGKNILRFSSDIEPELPGNGDPRKLGIMLVDFKILENNG